MLLPSSAPPHLSRRTVLLRALLAASAGGVTLAMAPLGLPVAAAERSLVYTAGLAVAQQAPIVRVLRTRYDPTLQHTINDVTTTLSGQSATAPFLTFYEHTGDIARWGYPTSEVLTETPGVLSQYFQRGVIDFHDRPDLGRHVLERRLVWDELAGAQGVEPPPTQPSGTVVGPWGHSVSDTLADDTFTGFATFFQQVGGVTSLGYPKTEARLDTGAPGQLHLPGGTPGFLRQYFQAGVLELHPDSSSPVQLALLGDALRDHTYPNGSWRQIAGFTPQAPLASGEWLGLSGPASTPSDAMPPRLQLQAQPSTVVQGQSFLLGANGPPGLTLVGSLDGNTVPFLSRPGGYWALGGFDPVAAPGPQQFQLVATDAGGTTVQQAALSIVVLAGDFTTRYATQNLVLPAGKERLLDPALEQAENAFLAPIFSHFTPQQRWQGRFIYPVNGFVLTTGFGERRVFVGRAGFSWHGGLDLAVPEGTPIQAGNDGVVTLAQHMTVRGNMTILDHGMGVCSGYLHQSRFAVEAGQAVYKGDIIGFVGSTGLSTGPHLHWEVRVHNVHVDPAQWTRERFVPS